MGQAAKRCGSRSHWRRQAVSQRRPPETAGRTTWRCTRGCWGRVPCGDTGKGAAIGAVAGTMAGGARQRQRGARTAAATATGSTADPAGACHLQPRRGGLSRRARLHDQVKRRTTMRATFGIALAVAVTAGTRAVALAGDFDGSSPFEGRSCCSARALRNRPEQNRLGGQEGAPGQRRGHRDEVLNRGCSADVHHEVSMRGTESHGQRRLSRGSHPRCGSFPSAPSRARALR